MPITTACPHCDQSYSLADQLEGKKVRCKNCEKTFLVVAVDAPRADPDREGRAVRRGVRKAPSGAKRAVREDPDEADDFTFDDEPGEGTRPRRSRKKKGGIPIWVWLLGGGGIFLFLCCGGGVGGFFLMGGMDRFTNKVTMENFDKVQTGMTEDEVRDILGPPTDESGTLDLPRLPRIPSNLQMKVLVWTKDDNSIAINFRNGKVMGKHGHFRSK